jgi:hypothetical protein
MVEVGTLGKQRRERSRFVSCSAEACTSRLQDKDKNKLSGERVCNSCYSKSQRAARASVCLAASTLQKLTESAESSSRSPPRGGVLQSTEEEHNTARLLLDFSEHIDALQCDVSNPSSPGPTWADTMRNSSGSNIMDVDGQDAKSMSNASTPSQKDHHQSPKHGESLAFAHLLFTFYG